MVPELCTTYAANWQYKFTIFCNLHNFGKMQISAPELARVSIQNSTTRVREYLTKNI
jgi:hypothetical protein